METVKAVLNWLRLSRAMWLMPSRRQQFFGEGQADQAAGVLGHEVDGPGRCIQRGDDDVAFCSSRWSSSSTRMTMHGLDVGDDVPDVACSCGVPCLDVAPGPYTQRSGRLSISYADPPPRARRLRVVTCTGGDQVDREFAAFDPVHG